MHFSSPTFSFLVSLVKIFCSFLTIFASINRISVLLSALCTWCLANHIGFWQSCLPGFYHPLSSFLRIFISSSQRHLKRAMNICFYFALRVSTLIFRVLNIGKEHYPIRTLIELTIISKIYNLKPNIFLMLITRTTLPECVWVYAIHIYVFKTTIWR